MPRRTLYALVVGGLLLVAAGPVAAVLTVSAATQRIEEAVQELIEHKTRSIRMQTLTDTWCYSVGQGFAEKTVTTTRNEDETVAAFTARHAELVAAQQELCPPVVK